MPKKKPVLCELNSPTTNPRSSNLLPHSQQVSGNKAQLWHVALLRDSGPWPGNVMQIGSEEHHFAFSNHF